MAFPQPRAGHASEPGLGLQHGYIGAAGVSHAGPEAPDQLVDDVADRTLVADATFDTFRHKFQLILDVLLKIAVGRTIVAP